MILTTGLAPFLLKNLIKPTSSKIKTLLNVAQTEKGEKVQRHWSKIQGLESSSAQYQELLLDYIKMAGCFHISARDGVRVNDLQIFLEKVELDTRDK